MSQDQRDVQRAIQRDIHESGLPMSALTYAERPSQLTLERYLLGELSPDEASALEAWSERDAELRARLNALKLDQLEAQRRFAPPPELLARVRDNQAPRAVSWWSQPWALMVAGGLFIIIAARISMSLQQRSISDQEKRSQETVSYHHSHDGHTRTKGSQGAPSDWEVYLAPTHRGDEAKLLPDLSEVYPDQTIGFRVYPQAFKYYLVIGRDSSRAWYLGAPQRGDASPVNAAKLPQLPTPAQDKAHSVDLTETLIFDETLGVEELYLALCANATPYESVRRELESLLADHTAQLTWPVSLSSRCEVQRARLTKVAPPKSSGHE